MSVLAPIQITVPAGNVVLVDKTCLDDEGVRGKFPLPFLTIQAAINAAVAGDVVRVRPGTYSELLTMKAGVSVIGDDPRNCVLSRAAAVGETAVTMATDMVFANFRLALAPSADTTTGVSFPTTTNATSRIENITVAGAPTGTGVVNPVSCTGTGTATTTHSTIDRCRLLGAGTGSIGLFVNLGSAAQVVTTRDSNIEGAARGIDVQLGTVYVWGSRASGGTDGVRLQDTSILNSGIGSLYSSLNLANGATLNRDLLEGPRGNHTSSIDPGVNDDKRFGYLPGSRWIDLSNDTAFVCLDATVGAAVWRADSLDPSVVSIGRETPGEHFLGTLLDYPSAANAPAGEIQYIRTWLTNGITIDSMQYFLDAGGSAARFVRMGLYEQTTPLSTTGVPTNRIAQTASTDTTGGNGFKLLPLTAPYAVTVTGYYWIAFITDSTAPQFAVTASMRANFLPCRREAGVGTTLPATVGVITNPVSALIYASAVE